MKLEYEGTKCDGNKVLHILLLAAARVASIFAVCRDLADAPCDQTIRNTLAVALTPVEQGERMKEVVRRLMKIIRRRGGKVRLLLLDKGFSVSR